MSSCTEAKLREVMSAGGLVRFCCDGTIILNNTIEVSLDVALDARDRDVVISGNNAVRLFSVSPGVRLSMTNLVLANGRHVGQNGSNGLSQPPPVGYPAGPGRPGQGGAVFNDRGTVELVACTLTNNHAIGGNGGTGGTAGALGGAGAGGAIFSQGGSILLDGVTLSTNVASGGAGGYWQERGILARGGDGTGGAIYSTNGSVAVVGCVLNRNLCTTSAGGIPGGGASARGGALFQASGWLSVSNSSLAANEAGGGDSPSSLIGFMQPGSAYGGAIAVLNGTVLIQRSHLASNTARGGNGFRHSGTGEAQGGAVHSAGDLLAFDSQFSGNRAVSGSWSSVNTDGRGGAVHNGGSAVFDRCSFQLNSAIGGHGAAFGSPGASFPGGHGLGGAVFNEAELAATNCTVSGNSATGGDTVLPWGRPGSALGGGIYSATGSVALANMTIASNYSLPAAAGSLFSGGAAGANVANTNGTFSLRNSIVAYGGTNGNAWGIVTDNGFNISSDGSADLNSGSSLNFTDPRLGPLGNFGGPTLTMALRPDSPAIDFGGMDGAPSEDQRGFPRPFGIGVDIGAYEFHSNQTEAPRLSIESVPGGVTLAFEALARTSYRLQASETASSPWLDLESLGPFAEPTTVTRTIEHDGTGYRFFRVSID